MVEMLSISRERLFSLLTDLAGYPNPDDPDNPDNPWGPWLRDHWLNIIGPFPEPWRVLGPVPDPWVVAGPSPDPWRQAGPGPQPWRLAHYSTRYAATAAAAVVRSSLSIAATAAALGGDLAGQAAESAKRSMFQFVDDYCGTPPRHVKWPGPIPPPFPREEPRPIDLLSAGLVFLNAARLVGDQELGATLAEAGGRIVQQSLQVG